MSNEITKKGYRVAGATMLGFGLVLVFGVDLPWLVGFAAFVVGFAFLVTPTIIDGVPRLVRWIWNSSEPAWDGEILHLDGGGPKVRYGFDPDGGPWFVAQDVCMAAGLKAPAKGAHSIDGAQLVRRNDLSCFSESSVRDYLAPLASGNHNAKRLLVLLQNQVLRKVEKSREQKRLYG